MLLTNHVFYSNLRITPHPKREYKQSGGFLKNFIQMNVGKLNTGRSLKAACMPWKGIKTGNVAIVTQQIAESDLFVTVHMRVVRVTIDSNEELTNNDLPDISEAESNKIQTYLGSSGIISVGAQVKYGDVLVGKKKKEKAIRPEGVVLETIFGANYRNTSVRMPLHDSGTVCFVERKGTQITIHLALRRKLSVGDILLEPKSGKEIVVGEIVPTKLMPRVKGLVEEPLDIIVTPMSELAGEFKPVPSDNEALTVVYSLENPGFILLAPKKGKSRKSKKWECLNEDAFLGDVFIQKKEQIFEEKIDSFGCVTGLTHYDQLAQGVAIKPVLIKTMLGQGLRKNVEEMISLRSDDMTRNGYKVHEALLKGVFAGPGMTAGTQRLKVLMMSLCFTADVDTAGLHSSLMTPEAILALSHGEIKNPETVQLKKLLPTEGGILDPRIFGPLETDICECGKFRGKKWRGTVCDECGVLVGKDNLRSERFGHITLAFPVINPFLKEEATLFLKTIDDCYKNDRTDYAQAFEEAGIAENSLLKFLPIIPPNWRPFYHEDGQFYTSHLNDLYRRVIIRNDRLKRLAEIKAPSVILANELRMLYEAVQSLFFGTKGDYSMKGLTQHLSETVVALYEKRAGYAGTGIVVPNNEVRIDTCVLPTSMALRLFEPYVFLALGNNKITDVIAKKHSLEIIDDRLLIALREVIRDKVILIVSPDQTKVYSFKVGFADCEAIQLHPEAKDSVGLFAQKRKVFVHLPMTPEAQEEAKSVLFSNMQVVPSDTHSEAYSLLKISTKELMEVAVGKKEQLFELSAFDMVLFG